QLKADFSNHTAFHDFITPLEDFLDGLVQITGGKWLGQVTIGSDLQPANFGIVSRQGGYHDDWNKICFAFQFQILADLESFDIGQEQIEKDEIGVVLANPWHCGPASLDDRRFKSPAPEMLRQQ